MPSSTVALPREHSVTSMSWYNESIVARYCKDHGVDEEAGRQCFHAFKQFLSVCGTSSVPRAPSNAIDDMWHTALLFTRDYREHCLRSFGRIIDHQPLDAPTDWTVYAATRREAERTFGSLDETYWVNLTLGDCSQNCTGQDPDGIADCSAGCRSLYQP